MIENKDLNKKYRDPKDYICFKFEYNLSQYLFETVWDEVFLSFIYDSVVLHPFSQARFKLESWPPVYRVLSKI